VLCESCCVLVLPRPLYSLFPYTTLFRSRPDHGPGDLRSLVAQGMERVVSTPERFLDLAGSHRVRDSRPCRRHLGADAVKPGRDRSEEHTSELQSRENLVCRLLLEKKKNI